MRIHKLSSTDAFVAFDLDDAPAVGVTRLARKVLTDGAELLARSTTYACASFGIQMGGGSAGINAEGDGRDPAVAAFIEEMRSAVAEGRWATDPALGLTEADLAPLRIDDTRPAELWTGGLAAALTGRGAAAAAGAVRPGGLAGATCAFLGTGPAVDAARTAVESAGGTATEGDGTDPATDIVFLAGKAGMLEHEEVAGLGADVVVPLTPVPVTARAHAELTKAGTVHVPDFLSTAAPLLHAHGDASDPAAAVAAVADKVASLAGNGTGLWLAAVEEAEAFLRTWREELPFGRPLA